MNDKKYYKELSFLYIRKYEAVKSKLKDQQDLIDYIYTELGKYIEDSPDWDAHEINDQTVDNVYTKIQQFYQGEDNGNSESKD